MNDTKWNEWCAKAKVKAAGWDEGHAVILIKEQTEKLLEVFCPVSSNYSWEVHRAGWLRWVFAASAKEANFNTSGQDNKYTSMFVIRDEE